MYVNFEDERLISFSTEDFNLLLQAHYSLYQNEPICFFDEIQDVEGWEKFARRLADEKRMIYITGSNAKMLSREMEGQLGARYLSLQIYPYNFQEYLSVNEFELSEQVLLSTQGKAKLNYYFNDYFRYGGFPELHNMQLKREYLSSVYQKVYLGDISLRHKITNSKALEILIKKIAESVCQPISFSRLANIIKTIGIPIGTSTVINYLEYAKESFLIFQVENYISNLVGKESNPKYYFIDNGLLNLFLINSDISLLENLVAINLIRKYGVDKVFYYKKNIKLDFYVPEENLAIQVCYSLSREKTADREINSLLKASEFLNADKKIIITMSEKDELSIKGNQINVIPVIDWLLSL